jgi:hypothetical protein
MDSELVSRAADASGDHRIRCVMLATSIWNNRMRATQFAFVLCSMWLSPANAGTVLITEQEASLPAKRGVAFDSRGITRAPRVELVQPVEVAYSPMRFQIRFQPSGGATVDLTTLRVTYLKTPDVDITSRVGRFVQPTGIDMPDAEAPAGEHYLRIEITDSEGRARSSVFSLKVSP